MYLKKICITGLIVSAFAIGQSAQAARIADISKTRHNFSASPVFSNTLPTGQTRDVRARDETQICVFCHTPHAAEQTQTPLWNRQLSTATYTTYNSASLDATPTGVALDQPNGVSKLCLSCHDGTMAVGAVNVLNGRFTDRDPKTQDVVMLGTSTTNGVVGTMALGEGESTGFTRYLGKDLTNDHPISVVYDATLAINDGEMRTPSSVSHIVVRGAAGQPRAQVDDVPLEPTPRSTTGGLVQCNSCHDPHIRDTSDENIKFLRLNRLQKADPRDVPFSKSTDIICLACHEKAGWARSAHANSAVADERYTAAAAAVREFPPNTQVWETACLACHDTHTVVGSRRLMREGVDGATRISADGYQIKLGTGQPAVEETCYACHSADRGTLQLQGTTGFEVPDTKTDFSTMARHMPITTNDQPNTFETHNIGTNNPAAPTQRGKDLIEDPVLMGPGNRHAECTDCHNMHRVVKNHVFNGNSNVPDDSGTHNHTAPHTNIASGVLKGVWGVQPVYGSDAFGSNPVSFQLKRGNPVPDIGASTAVNSTWVTREYQVCFKCHSNYAFGTTPPALSSFTGGTPRGTNGMQQYTNIAMEYNSPNSHRGEGTSGTSGGAAAAFAGNNHRSWHPVQQPTGRTAAIRNANPNNWRAPFNGAVGSQTMYCTDCHGSNTVSADGAVPSGGVNGFPWGPHGSNNDFILKGGWSGNRTSNTDGTGNVGTGGPGSSPENLGLGGEGHLCFKCHEFTQYGTSSDAAGGMGAGGMGAVGAGGAQNSGFSLGAAGCMGGCMGGATNNLHIYHHAVVNTFRCNLCHVAVPHGWKNKVFLVNLNDVGPEAGLAPGTQVRNGAGGAGGMGGGAGGGAPAVTFPPYYNRAALKVASFATSGNWSPSNCGSAGAPGNGAIGVNWMFMSSEACNNLP